MIYTDANNIGSRIKSVPTDHTKVDQGAMLNYLVGALAAVSQFADVNGKISVKTIADVVERSYDKNKLH